MCSEEISHSKVRVEEQGKKAIFLNPERSRYRRTKIDGCVIDEGARCDYLVTKVGSASVLVELKGTDVQHGCEQLFATAKYREVRRLTHSNPGFLLVCARYPRFDSFVIKAKGACAKIYKTGFHIVTNQCEVDISEVVKIDGKVS